MLFVFIGAVMLVGCADQSANKNDEKQYILPPKKDVKVSAIFAVVKDSRIKIKTAKKRKRIWSGFIIMTDLLNNSRFLMAKNGTFQRCYL